MSYALDLVGGRVVPGMGLDLRHAWLQAGSAIL